MKRQFVYSKLPRAGFGNKLFIWAQGLVFAKVNNCDYITLGWVKLHIGPLLRKEKSKRLYLDYVQMNAVIWPMIRLKWWQMSSTLFKLSQAECDKQVDKNGLFQFDRMPHSDDYFVVLSHHRETIRSAFWNYFNPDLLKISKSANAPQIGVHIRLGDFKLGGLTTHLSWYIEAIEKVRSISGKKMEVTIFSDGRPEELQDILNLPDVKMAASNKDIVDLAILSQSEVIIMTSNSTFSLWAGFLSDAVLIYDKKYVQRPLRINNDIFEGDIHELVASHLVHFQHSI